MVPQNGEFYSEVKFFTTWMRCKYRTYRNGRTDPRGKETELLVGKEVPNLTRIDDDDPNLTRSYNILQQTEGVQQFTKLGKQYRQVNLYFSYIQNEQIY